MTGDVFATASHLRDELFNFGYFFIFADLAIRSSGKYRLKFTMFDPQASVQIDSSACPSGRCLASIYSDEFIVHTPKAFPGMKGATPLILAFINQGEPLTARALQ